MIRKDMINGKVPHIISVTIGGPRQAVSGVVSATVTSSATLDGA